jgi:hypothetical protein
MCGKCLINVSFYRFAAGLKKGPTAIQGSFARSSASEEVEQRLREAGDQR